MRTMTYTFRRYKLQTAFEFIFIVGMLLAAVIMGTWYSWSRTTDVENSENDMIVGEFLSSVAEKINTAWLEGEGYSTNVTMPMTIAGQPYEINITENYLVVKFLDQERMDVLITNNITGNFTIGAPNRLTNRKSFIEITPVS